jgi:hypothetical protein
MMRVFPSNKRPWGVLNAIDLDRGEVRWQVPLGTYPKLEARGLPATGPFNIGGPLVTAGGLVFIGAAMDQRFHAFDKQNGKLLWEFQLDAGGYATPASFEIKGREYVVIAAGGAANRKPNPATPTTASLCPNSFNRQRVQCTEVGMKRQRNMRPKSGGILCVPRARACPLRDTQSKSTAQQVPATNHFRSGCEKEILDLKPIRNPIRGENSHPISLIKILFQNGQVARVRLSGNRQYEMQIALQEFDKHRSADPTALRREVESLRRQFREIRTTARPLAWDTELLVRKDPDLDRQQHCFVLRSQWQQSVEQHAHRSGWHSHQRHTHRRTH